MKRQLIPNRAKERFIVDILSLSMKRMEVKIFTAAVRMITTATPFKNGWVDFVNEFRVC